MKGHDPCSVAELKLAATAELGPFELGDHRVFSGGDENTRAEEVAFYGPPHLLDREGNRRRIAGTHANKYNKILCALLLRPRWHDAESISARRRGASGGVGSKAR